MLAMPLFILFFFFFFSFWALGLWGCDGFGVAIGHTNLATLERGSGDGFFIAHDGRCLDPGSYEYYSTSAMVAKSMCHRNPSHNERHDKTTR